MTLARGVAHDDRGQATVELALTLPVIVVLILAVVQVGSVVHDVLLVNAAAREAVRAAAVTRDDAAARHAALEGRGLDPDRLAVDVRRGAAGPDTVVAQVRYRSSTDVPMIGALLPDITLAGQATMRQEGP